MAVWTKALPLTASYPFSLPRFKCQLGRVRKLPVTWGWVLVFTWSSGFLHYLQLASQNFSAIDMAEK